MHVSDIPQLQGLSMPERILLVEEMWDAIAAEEAGVPIPESHKAELDKRLNAYEANPGTLLTLEELQARINRSK